MTRIDFNELVHRLSHKLYGYAFRILHSQEEAEDAVQEVFIKLWKLNDKLGEYNSIDALATTMVKNHCIDQIRKEKNIFKNDDSSHLYVVSQSPSPEEQMVNRESDEIIHKIIENLPEIYRTVIRFRDIEGFSYEETAEKTAQTVNNLRVILSRARKMIRDEFNKYQYEQRGTQQADRKVL
jgi:RNA polymerase sigma-70 factor (ECF subfamily)